MKQMSDVETTTSSRPPLTSLLMAPLAAVWSDRFAFIIRCQALQATRMRVDDFYDRHPISEQQVLAAVARRRGGDLSQLSPDDLFEFDQDHYGGLQAVDELASRAGVATASHVLDACGRLAFTDWIAHATLGERERARLAEWMAATTLQSLEGYRALLGRAGFVGVESEDLSDEWRSILRARLASLRAMRRDMAARLGEARFGEYEQLYAFFVGLVEEGKLGGGRFSGSA